MLEFFKKILALVVAAFSSSAPEIGSYVSTAINVVNGIKNAVDNPDATPSFPDDILPFVDQAILATGLINKGALETTQDLIMAFVNMIRNASGQHQNMFYHKVASNLVRGLSKDTLSEHQADTIVQVQYAADKDNGKKQDSTDGLNSLNGLNGQNGQSKEDGKNNPESAL